MKQGSRWSLAAVVVLLAGCSTVQVGVENQAHPDIDRSGFVTYQWNPKSQAPSGHPQLSADELDQALRQGIDEGLQQVGLRKVDADADVLVGYSAAIAGELEVTAIDHQFGYGPGMSGRLSHLPGYRGYVQPAIPASQTVRTFKQGTLVLDIVEQTSGTPVWRSVAEAEVDQDMPPEDRAKRLAATVSRMLEGFK